MIALTLNRYIIREFLVVFIAALGAFLLVCLVGDAAERLSKFIDAKAPLKLILLFYLFMVPFYLVYILPASSLIATLFTLGQMNRHNELTAMRSSGVSLGRIFLPLLVLMLVISALAFVIDETVVPPANTRKSEILDYRIRGRIRPSAEVRHNLDYLGEDGRRWIAASFHRPSSSLKGVRLLKLAPASEHPRIEYRIDARQALWRPDSGWCFSNGTLRLFDTEGRGSELAARFERMHLRGRAEVPEDFALEVKEPQQMNYQELNLAIGRKMRNGIRVTKDRVELWLKTSMPLASFVIVLFGAPLAVTRRRIGPGIGMALGLIVYMAFMGSFYITRSLGYNGILHPAAAAWTSNIVFGLCGLIFFLRVRR
ncbi:MAG: LptF/LptG family permease [Gemmatimonadota bacterium]|nr:LptF/LptG family permease [Gemmatimonadota bacterium]